ncbi:flavocytochrome c [Deltaproteobacteria bacterium]|nr:flavocytochrome c [Deltaproteobacteria bacterium]
MLPLLLACDPPDSADPSTGRDTSDTSESAAVDTTTDVIIVGSGPAGVAAALSATEAGAEVILFERDEIPGIGVRLAGLALGVNTSWQAAEGIEDSVALAASEWPMITGEPGDEPGVQGFLTESADTITWLVGHGAQVGDLMLAVGEGTVPRLHMLVWPDAPTPYEILMTDFSGEVRAGVEVTEPLFVDGALAGVRWRNVLTGEEGATGAAAVVLASGGFLRDLDAVSAVRPDLTAREPLFETNLGSFGSTLPFLTQVGAGRSTPEAIGAYLHAIQDPREPEGEALLLQLGSPYILVGADGRRFTSDTNLGDFGPILDAPEGDLWLIAAGSGAAAAGFSAPAYNWSGNTGEPESLSIDDVAGLGSEDVFVADTLEELAALTGLGTGLVEEVDEFDARAAAGASDPFGRILSVNDVLSSPPWVAVNVHPGLAKNFGGVATDVSGHVLDADGAVIPGLYAAGEVAGMILAGGSGTGFSGSVGACYQGGRAAGTTAAAEAALR